ncbi:MAG: hypothetical protein AABY55_04240 [Candidatus Omnitrophota bacterium]
MRRKKIVPVKKSKKLYKTPEIEKVRVTSSYRMACTAPGGDTSPHSAG